MDLVTGTCATYYSNILLQAEIEYKVCRIKSHTILINSLNLATPCRILLIVQHETQDKALNTT